MDMRIGVIGGSGLGGLLGGEGGRRHELDTPFGKPSDAIIEVEWEGLNVFLLSRHGAWHLLNPSVVPYRAASGSPRLSAEPYTRAGVPSWKPHRRWIRERRSVCRCCPPKSLFPGARFDSL